MSVRKAFHWWALRFTISFSAVALPFGCTTMSAPPISSDASIIAGQLKLTVSGEEISVFGSSGVTSATYARGATGAKWATVGLCNETSGETYVARAVGPDGLFRIVNADPGQYIIQKLWCQVQTHNSWVTFTTTFTTPPSFEVDPRRIVDLGVIDWEFAYDLPDSTSTGSVRFTQNFSPVKGEISRLVANTPWSAYEISKMTVNTEKSQPISRVSSPMPGTWFVN
jgi:hypothetical protein